jgi:hypothetical protein
MESNRARHVLGITRWVRQQEPDVADQALVVSAKNGAVLLDGSQPLVDRTSVHLNNFGYDVRTDWRDKESSFVTATWRSAPCAAVDPAPGGDLTVTCPVCNAVFTGPRTLQGALLDCTECPAELHIGVIDTPESVN